MTAHLSHAALCDGLGIPHYSPRPDWLPYAAQATIIRIEAAGRIITYGGSMRCGQCEYGVDIRPGDGAIGPNGPTTAADTLACPKCGYTGASDGRAG